MLCMWWPWHAQSTMSRKSPLATEYIALSGSVNYIIMVLLARISISINPQVILLIKKVGGAKLTFRVRAVFQQSAGAEEWC